MPDPIKPTAADYAAAENAASAANLVTNDGYYEFDLEKLTESFALHAQQAREQVLEEAAKVAAATMTDARTGEIDTDLRSISHILQTRIRALKEQPPC